jgi:hypothetical protein
MMAEGLAAVPEAVQNTPENGIVLAYQVLTCVFF